MRKFFTLPKYAKWSALAYSSIVLGTFTTSCYLDGKKELHYEKHRTRYIHAAPSQVDKLEWEAVKRGCYENAWSNFVSSTLFPLRLVENIIPYIILLDKPTLKQNSPSVSAPEKSKN